MIVDFLKTVLKNVIIRPVLVFWFINSSLRYAYYVYYIVISKERGRYIYRPETKKFLTYFSIALLAAFLLLHYLHF